MSGRGSSRSNRGDAAVGSSVVAFLVAGVLFMASVVAVLVTTRTGSDTQATADAPDSAAFQVQAKGLADLLLGSPGYAGGAKFANGIDPNSVSFNGKLADADSVTRLGLLDPDSTEPGMMDFAKFQNLRLAPLAKTTDQYVNYEEAAATLGLGTNLDFHIRSYPSLASVADMLADVSKRDRNLRVAYVADSVAAASVADPTAGLTLGRLLGTSKMTCTVDEAAAPEALIITSSITMDVGGSPTAFEAVFDFEFSNQDKESRKRNTGLVTNDPNVDVPIVVHLGAIGSRDCSGLKATLKLYDTDNLLMEASTPSTGFPVPPWPIPDSPSSRPARALRLDASSMSYLDSEDVVLDWTLSKDLEEHDQLYITVCPGTTECRISDSLGLLEYIDVAKKEQDRDPWTIPAADLAVGTYTARLYLDSVASTSYRATQTILVTDNAAPIAPYVNIDPPPGSSVAIEVGFLEDLMGKFCPTWYNTKVPKPEVPSDTPLPASEWTGGSTWDTRCASFKTGQPHFGDVYPQRDLRRVLEERLTKSVADGGTSSTSSGSCRYAPTYDYTNILVIGSNVDHNRMTSGDVKDCIQDWVLGGGTLIVLGSLEGKTEWLQSTFKVALEGSSTGINVPDTAHPVLHTPNELGWPAYQHQYSWRLKETGKFDSEAAFTRVVNEAGTDPNAILAVSDPGDFQGGSVILTGWTPYDLNGAATASLLDEGRKLLHNLLMLGYRDLYLDYGPALPEFSNVIPAVRGTQICHPEFDEAAPGCQNAIDLRMLVYVFPSTG